MLVQMDNPTTMKKLQFSLFLLISIFLITSCEDDSKPIPIGNLSGRPGEVVIVCKKSEWNGEVGDSIQSIFHRSQYGLPQDEPYFNLIQTTDQNFNKIFKTFRNILYVDIDTNRMSKAELSIKRSVWAKGQLIARIDAPDKASFLNLLSENRNVLINYFNNKELDRLYLRNKQFGSKEIQKKVFENYSLRITPMKDAYIATEDSNVVWLRVERKRDLGGFEHQISQGVLIFYTEYTDRMNLLDTNLLASMDDYLKKFVPGPVDSSYMTLDYKYVPPVSTEINYHDHYAKEFRGLWRMKNYMMGGPMVALTVLDEENDRIVYAIGYVYAPQFDKREYLREMDAVIKSLQFKDEEPKKKAQKKS